MLEKRRCSPASPDPAERIGGRSFAALLTEYDLARRHGRSVKTIRNLRVRGGYVPFLKIGRHVRYRIEDILAFEDCCRRNSTSDFERENNDAEKPKPA
jgi:hypothetical protein